MRFSLITKLAVIALLVSSGTALNAQQTTSMYSAQDAVRVNIENGNMSGFVFQNLHDKQNRVPARVTLASGQKVLATQITDQNGSFRSIT